MQIEKYIFIFKQCYTFQYFIINLPNMFIKIESTMNPKFYRQTETDTHTHTRAPLNVLLISRHTTLEVSCQNISKIDLLALSGTFKGLKI